MAAISPPEPCNCGRCSRQNDSAVAATQTSALDETQQSSRARSSLWHPWDCGTLVRLGSHLQWRHRGRCPCKHVGERSSMPEQAVPVRGLFESHLTVSDLSRSVAFYRDVVGLPVALEVPERGAAFFWCGASGKTMLGLWSLGSTPMGLSLHVAFDVELQHVLDSPAQGAGRHAALVLRPRNRRANGYRLDAGGDRVLPRPRWSPARVPRHARHGASSGSRNHSLVRVDSGAIEPPRLPQREAAG